MGVNKRYIAVTAAAVLISGLAYVPSGAAQTSKRPADWSVTAPQAPAEGVPPSRTDIEQPAAESTPENPIDAAMRIEAEADRLLPPPPGESVFAQRGDTTVELPPDPASAHLAESETAPVPDSVNVEFVSPVEAAAPVETSTSVSVAPDTARTVTETTEGEADTFGAAAVGPSVSGTVTSGGLPLSGATITSQPNCYTNSSTTSTTSAADGTYTLTLPVSLYYVYHYVRFDAPGKATEVFEDGTCVGFRSDQSQLYTNVNADLATAGSITGTVTREDAGAVGLVTVYASTFGFSTSTTTTGAYTLNGLPPGLYTVSFQSSDADVYDEYYNGTRVYQQAAFVTVTGGATAPGINASLTSLPAVGTIEGTVVDAAANPVQAVDVSVEELVVGPSGYEYWTWFGQTSTDTTGEYAMELPTGSYRVQFLKSGYAPQYFDAAATPETAAIVPVASGTMTAGVDAALVDASSISGVVTTAAGAPVEDADVFYGVTTGGYFNGYGGTTTAPDGSYTIADVPAGDWVVMFAKPGYIREFWNNALNLEQAGLVSVLPSTPVTAINAELAAGGTISGTVSLTSGPAAYANVFACYEGGEPCFYTTADALGNYTIVSLRSGNYLLRFTTYSGGQYVSEYYNDAQQLDQADLVPVTAPSTTTNIDALLSAPIGGGSISGVVTDAGGLPLVSAYVQSTNAFVITNSNGEYTLPSLPTGAHFLTVGAANYITEYWNNVTDPMLATSINVTPGSSTSANVQLAQIPAASGATISGIATAPFGGGIQITAYRVGGFTLGYVPNGVNTYIASGAPYTMTVVPGVYDVCFDAVNAATKCFEGIVVANGANVINTTLTRLATINFIVTNSDGGTARSGSVSLCYRYTDPAIDYNDFGGFGSCFSFGNNQITGGRTRLSVTPGTYQFRLSTPDGSRVTDLMTFPAGVTDVPITMPAPVPTTGGISGVVRGPNGLPLAGVPVTAGNKQTTTTPDGSYLFTGLRAAPTAVDFGPYGTSPVPYRREGYRDDAQTSGSLVTPPAGSTLTGVNARLDSLTTLSGVAPPSGGVCVTTFFLQGCTTASPSGEFSVQIQPGQPVSFCTPDYYKCYLVNGSSAPLSVGWRTRTDLILTLPSAGSGTVSGSLTWNGGAPPLGSQVYLEGVAGSSSEYYSDAVIATNGAYQFTQVPAGSYIVSTTPSYAVANFLALHAFFRTAGTTTRQSLATPVVVTAGATVANINMALPRVGRLKVTITSGGVAVPNSFLQNSSGFLSGFSGKNRLADGVAVLAFVSGDVTLRAWRTGSTEAEPDVTASAIVVPGVETNVSIALPTATRPGRPPSVTVTPGIGSATLNWTAPLSNGGSAITSYLVQVDPAPLRQSASYTVTGTNTQIIGLTNASRYTFSVSAVNAVGAGPPKLAQTIPNGCLGTPFTDIANGYVFCEAIDWMVGRGITTGFANSTFGPLLPINRDAMAAFLYRFAGEPSSPASTSCGASAVTGPFTDVAPTYVFCRAIEWMKQTGITNGFPDGSFKPQQPINRDAMSAFLYRFAGQPSVPASTSCGAVATGPFTDVAPTYQFCRAIEWMKQVGITTGFPDGSFKPQQPINRDAIAAFLFRFDDKNIPIP